MMRLRVPRFLPTLSLLLLVLARESVAFRTVGVVSRTRTRQTHSPASQGSPACRHVAARHDRRPWMMKEAASSKTALSASPDLDVIALVAGQENYGLAVVALGEGIYSFLQAPSFGNIKVLIPPVVAAVVLFAVSGPMITAGSEAALATVGTGLWIATAVSVALGASYVLRLLEPPGSGGSAPKEIAALGLLIAVAGFFSFGQNLIVDGFVTLPSVNIPLPSFPQNAFDFLEG